MLNSLGMQQQKYTLLSMNILYPAVGNTDLIFTCMKTPYCNLPYQKPYTPYILQSVVCALTHLQQPLCCFNPIQYDAEVPFTTTCNLPITPFKYPAYWTPRAKTYQEKDPENKNESEEVTKCFHLYLCSTKCTQNWNTAALIKRRGNDFGQY